MGVKINLSININVIVTNNINIMSNYSGFTFDNFYTGAVCYAFDFIALGSSLPPYHPRRDQNGH